MYGKEDFNGEITEPCLVTTLESFFCLGLWMITDLTVRYLQRRQERKTKPNQTKPREEKRREEKRREEKTK